MQSTNLLLLLLQKRNVFLGMSDQGKRARQLIRVYCREFVCNVLDFPAVCLSTWMHPSLKAQSTPHQPSRRRPASHQLQLHVNWVATRFSPTSCKSSGGIAGTLISFHLYFFCFTSSAASPPSSSSCSSLWSGAPGKGKQSMEDVVCEEFLRRPDVVVTFILETGWLFTSTPFLKLFGRASWSAAFSLLSVKSCTKWPKCEQFARCLLPHFSYERLEEIIALP